jgi:hypothetical protein
MLSYGRGVLIATCCAVCLATGTASAQDFFELEVFDAEPLAAGNYEIGVHMNGAPSGSSGAPAGGASHRPAHVSVEVTRGWTSRFETAVFLQTAPFGSKESLSFAGGHVRGTVRLGEIHAARLRLALGVEYAFNRAAIDEEIQTLEIRPIADYRRGRLSLVANPTLEVVTRGPEGTGLEPVFDISARAAWQLIERMALTTDYFSAAANARHLRPERGAHHLIFAGTELELASSWVLEMSAGHCVTRREPWLMRSVIGYTF